MSIWDFEDLARHLCGLSDDDDSTDIDQALLEKFEIDLPQFATLVEQLLPLCMIAQSPLTNTVYRGFGKADERGGLWLLKQEVEG